MRGNNLQLIIENKISEERKGEIKTELFKDINQRYENTTVNIQFIVFKTEFHDYRKKPFLEFLLLYLTTFVVGFQFSTELHANYSIRCNDFDNSFIFENKPKVFTFGFVPEVSKFVIISSFSTTYKMLSLTEQVGVFAFLGITMGFLFTDFPNAYEKSEEDALNQFKENFKMNLEKTAQACKVEESYIK